MAKYILKTTHTFGSKIKHWCLMQWRTTVTERVRFQGLNSVALFTFKNKYFSSWSRFGAHIVSTVILTNYECTHKATTRQSVWNRFYWQSKIRPPICTESNEIERQLTFERTTTTSANHLRIWPPLSMGTSTIWMRSWILQHSLESFDFAVGGVLLIEIEVTKDHKMTVRGRIHWQKVLELIKKHTCK